MDKQVVAGNAGPTTRITAPVIPTTISPTNYAYIRKAWLVYENIDKVADMSDRDKAIVKAEMQVLVAFRYVEMLKRYGGVPLVESTLTTVDVRPAPPCSKPLTSSSGCATRPPRHSRCALAGRLAWGA